MVFDQIKEILAEQFGIEKDNVKLDTSFVADLEADSIDIADLLTTVSEKFDIEIDSEPIKNFKVVEDLVKFVEKSKS
jgi:acyl carrier protein